MPHFSLPLDQRGNPIQSLAPDPSKTVTVPIGVSSNRVALPSGVGERDIVRVAGNAACFVRFGDSSVIAAGTDALFPVGTEVFRVPPGATHLAVVQDGAVTGILTITEMI